jgi:hypothetical protein
MGFLGAFLVTQGWHSAKLVNAMYPLIIASSILTWSVLSLYLHRKNNLRVSLMVGFLSPGIGGFGFGLVLLPWAIITEGGIGYIAIGSFFMPLYVPFILTIQWWYISYPLGLLTGFFMHVIYLICQVQR